MANSIISRKILQESSLEFAPENKTLKQKSKKLQKSLKLFTRISSFSARCARKNDWKISRPFEKTFFAIFSKDGKKSPEKFQTWKFSSNAAKKVAKF